MELMLKREWLANQRANMLRQCQFNSKALSLVVKTNFKKQKQPVRTTIVNGKASPATQMLYSVLCCKSLAVWAGAACFVSKRL
jgi:hypothetical protein